MKTSRAALTIMLGICSFTTMAGKPVDLTRIVERQQALAAQFETPEAIEETGLEMRQIEAIREAQTTVFSTIGDRKMLSELSDDEKVDLKNALESIDVALKGTKMAELNREKCWREQKLGTKLKVTRCATQLEMNQLREGAREWWEKADICVGSSSSNTSCGATK